MNGRFLALALGLATTGFFCSNIAFAEAPAPEAAGAGKRTTEDASKGEHAEKHKEHGKKSGEHEKAHHKKGEAGEAKEAK